MKTIFEMPTRGDEMTLPGGVALRHTDGKFVVHNFNTDRETGKTREYWNGAYFHTDPNADDAFADAAEEFATRIRKSAYYDTGGSIDIEKLIA